MPKKGAKLGVYSFSMMEAVLSKAQWCQSGRAMPCYICRRGVDVVDGVAGARGGGCVVRGARRHHSRDGQSQPGWWPVIRPAKRKEHPTRSTSTLSSAASLRYSRPLPLLSHHIRSFLNYSIPPGRASQPRPYGSTVPLPGLPAREIVVAPRPPLQPFAASLSTIAPLAYAPLRL
jgi:hypothetical protein